MDDLPRSALVGRASEQQAIAGALRDLPGRSGLVLAVEGEPGIGKSRLLEHLAGEAEAVAAVVVGARASEFERDLPYALWTEALDRHLAGAGERRRSPLELADPDALATVLPALGGVTPASGPVERHRLHRALRELLEQLAAARPLVVWMDDLQWADPASVGALAALVHRPPAAAVLLAVAAREGLMPAELARALAGAHRDDRIIALSPGPLSEAEAIELIGDAAATIFPQAGGNPFYLEQLARVREAPEIAPVFADNSVPAAVAAALSAELAALTPPARRVLDGAAVVGDPFDPDLAAAVAELDEPAALPALDELVARTLVRPAGVPRRFAFRHPVVRHSVYAAIAPGWRLGAHARAAAALQRRGAGVVERAHHVEHAAAAGDGAAIALLSTAAGELQGPAPRTAARFYASALRLLPADAGEPEHRTRLQR
ncbi:MAG TPA: AAA family ATPase, partial [Baekduia sp.]|nr:AAA family ATPase [Baekduia sp.]